jgi:hypothetical protein
MRSKLHRPGLAAVVGFATVCSLLWIGAGESAAPTAPAALGDLARHLDPGFARDPYFADGKAEINSYQAQLQIYGAPRQAASLIHIVVSEDHLPESLVKADDWRTPGLVPMLKFNYVTSVRTGIYTYQQMLSFFFERADLHLAKMTLAHHEWCGNSFKELVNFRGRSAYSFNTYWEGQGDGSFPVAFPADLVVYDALPVQLRALRFADGMTATFPLLGRQLSSKAAPPSWPLATLRVKGAVREAVPAGAFEVWRLDLRHAGGVDQLAFERAFPHRLVSWQRADGDTFALAKSQKLAYWQMNGPGDEAVFE